MKTFYQLLANTIIAGVTNNFVWFALIFWAFLETQAVLATSILSGIYLSITALSGFWFGSLVDHHKKKVAMMTSSIATVLLFTLGLILFITTPEQSFTTVDSPHLWILSLLLLFGVIAGNIRTITMPTLVTILVTEKKRDRANGLLGSATGVAFAITSVASGLALARYGMLGVIVIAIGFTLLALLHLLFISVPEKGIVHMEDSPKPATSKNIDIKGTIKMIASVPGLFALIFFTTFNNFLGGVFMSLMDAYALTLMSVENWGYLLGIVSMGFIIGGLIIAKKGLGKNPLKLLFQVNIIMWVVSMTFTIQPSILLLAIGMFIWICLVPFIEAIEHTIIQKVVPYHRQGRVFGFAQSIEQAASPLTSFIIGPIAQFIFIPFMTTGTGVALIGEWYGTGVGRGIGLVFTITGIFGLIVTLIAMRSKPYKLLSKRYAE
ncbi:MFS transporter [Candidatus Roizmanbacteria bacterium]|nr:MFS transporter [Candidatus Roizmanbacteria bacterium]